jgi:hypothetical protein
LRRFNVSPAIAPKRAERGPLFSRGLFAIQICPLHQTSQPQTGAFCDAPSSLRVSTPTIGAASPTFCHRIISGARDPPRAAVGNDQKLDRSAFGILPGGFFKVRFFFFFFFFFFFVVYHRTLRQSTVIAFLDFILLRTARRKDVLDFGLHESVEVQTGSLDFSASTVMKVLGSR